MTEETASTTSGDSSILSSGAKSDGTETTAECSNTGDNDSPPLDEILDRSKDADAAEKSLALKNEGNQFLIAGKFLDAIRLYSEALEYTPTNAIILSNRAQAYIKIENYGLALVDADTAIESDKSYAKAFYRRASAHFALNKYKLARKDFKQVCKLKPKDRDARAKLAECEKRVREEAFASAIESEQTAPISSTMEADKIPIDKTYDGPHPGSMSVHEDMEIEASFFEPGKLPLDFVLAAIERFKSQKLIHKRYVARLLISCSQYFATLPSLMEISLPSEPPENSPEAAPRVTVCGDTHGQFYDVMNIFAMNGYPSANNPYVFNGDFVDRGSFSVEVILSFLLFKIYDPRSIFLHRGNHETRNMNRIYGFEGEVRHKYDEKIFDIFLEVFCNLPLASVIGGKVFVTHGGLSVNENVTLDDIRNISRGTEPPESGLMSDLLWSDPQPFPGKSPSKRGVGFSFGPDITRNFLDRNNLQLLVRSHEVKEEGYLVEHGGKTITVFSAPNYCDTMGNKGAFIHFEESMEPKFTQYDAVPHPNVKPMQYALGMGASMF